MVFMSERIINISELEALLSAARLNFEILMDECVKKKSFHDKIKSTELNLRGERRTDES